MVRDFKGIWIPREIWLNEELNASEKVLFAEIHSLSSLEQGCFASNEYFATFLGCSESAVQKYIAHLKNLGLVEVLSFDGRKRILGVCLPNNEKQTRKIYEADSEILCTNNTSIKTDNKNNIYTYTPEEKNENLTIKKSLLQETTNHQHHVAAGGENFAAAEKVEKPNFVDKNRENFKKEFIEKPKYDFDGIRNLPLERGYNQSYKNTFEKKMKKAGFLTNTHSAEIINKNFPDFWTKYIVELETAVNSGKDIGLFDTLHIINKFPEWFEAKTQGKETKQTYQSKGNYSKQQPQSTVAQTVNLEKTIAKQAMQTTDSKRVGYYELQGIYNDLVENYCQKHALPFETFQITFTQTAGLNIKVIDHAPNEHSQNLINHLFSQFSNLKK